MSKANCHGYKILELSLYYNKKIDKLEGQIYDGWFHTICTLSQFSFITNILPYYFVNVFEIILNFVHIGN